MKCSDLISTLNGVGAKTAALFGKLGIVTLGDLLNYYPRDYEEYQKPKPVTEWEFGQIVSVYGRISKAPDIYKTKQLVIVQGNASDERQFAFALRWYNQPYLRSVLKTGQSYVFRGKLVYKNHMATLEQPQFYKIEDYKELSGKMFPVYPLTKGLGRTLVMKCVRQALEAEDISSVSMIDEETEQKYHLDSYEHALRQIHYPDNQKAFLQSRKRIVFEEFFQFIVGVRSLKEQIEQAENAFMISRNPLTDELIRKLPFQLTSSQSEVITKIREELSGKKVMHRLIQGDVGSGKTILAFLALYEVALAGYQGVLMAPTEVLAVQHYEAFLKLMERQEPPVRATLLLGSNSASEKKEIYHRIKNGGVDVIIGTHAVFQEKVEYSNLALVITDEQHRFGVKQREMLSRKGEMPHSIVMSATPIPRTLAMILYGDLDISLVKEKPANRLPIKNCVIDASSRVKAYSFLLKELRKGHQAFVICSMVEESELMDGENVIDYAKKLRGELSACYEIGVLHGRMGAKEKEQVMREFASGKLHVLVSTTVIEVGVDVSNATVMIVEDAQRFGLAQLHQLRGRVGRGDAQSYCIFISSDGNAQENERLQVLNHSNDGFFIASEDLRLRGPGDILGIRQSGILQFRLGDVFQDEMILKEAAQAADDFIRDGRPILCQNVFTEL